MPLRPSFLLRPIALLCVLAAGLAAAVFAAPPGALCLQCRSAHGSEGPRLILRTGLVWRTTDPAFGGLSGLEVTEGGTRALALSDHAVLFHADLIRDPATGAMTAMRLAGSERLLDRGGHPLTPFNSDAEDLALDATGALFIAFEGLTRVAGYRAATDAGRVAQALHPWNLFRTRFGNTGFEALSALPGGGLLAIGEVALPGVDTGPGAPAFAWRDGHWRHAFDIPDPAGFTVSGADLGPDGRLWLLERRLGPAGFVTRIRRFALDTASGLPVPGPAETLLEASLGPRDNYEGISVWQDAAGCTIATLISDDGFSALQRTAVAEFVLAGQAATACSASN